MAVRREDDKADGRVLAVSFRCPGCGDTHWLNVDPASKGPCWTWNGSTELPTIRASIMAKSGHYCYHAEPGDCWCNDPEAPFACYVCHSFVTDGRIEFLADCSHALAGQTVDLPEIDRLGVPDSALLGEEKQAHLATEVRW